MSQSSPVQEPDVSPLLVYSARQIFALRSCTRHTLFRSFFFPPFLLAVTAYKKKHHSAILGNLASQLSMFEHPFPRLLQGPAPLRASPPCSDQRAPAGTRRGWMLQPTGKSDHPTGLQRGKVLSKPFPALSERQQSQEPSGSERWPCLSPAPSEHPAWKRHTQRQERPAKENCSILPPFSEEAASPTASPTVTPGGTSIFPFLCATVLCSVSYLWGFSHPERPVPREEEVLISD